MCKQQTPQRPLGLLSPALIAYKIFIQKFLQDKLQCDELLTAQIATRIESAAADYSQTDTTEENPECYLL